MKIRPATFFHERKGGKESGKETSAPYLRCLQMPKGQPQPKGLSLLFC